MNLELDAHPHLKQDLIGFPSLQGKFFVRIEGRFESSHYLYAYLPDGSDEPVHGHSWLAQVSLEHQNHSVQENGISFDFLTVRKRLDELLERIEHICINDLEEFKNVNPTAENIARWFYQGLHTVVRREQGQILEIRIHEGPENVAVFCPVLPNEKK